MADHPSPDVAIEFANRITYNVYQCNLPTWGVATGDHGAFEGDGKAMSANERTDCSCLQMLIVVFFLITMILGCNCLVCAELYRWTDENGVIHFSDQPPPPSTTKEKAVQVLKMAAPSLLSSAKEEGGKEYVIPFQRAHGGMVVNVMVNDRVPARMVVDTGATTVKVNVGLLKRLGQYTPAEGRKRKAWTAAGVIDAQEVTIEKIDLGGAVKRDVAASFTDEAHDYPHYDGLLGLSFLSDFKMTIDYEKNIIHLKR